MIKRAITSLLVAGALLGLVTPQPLDAAGRGGGGGGRSSGGTPRTYTVPKAPKSTVRAPSTRTRAASATKSTRAPNFKAARYKSTKAERTYKAPPAKAASYWSSGNTRTVSGRVRTVDGDTFVTDGRRVRVRGVDTWELSQPKGFAARQRLDQLLNSGSVTVDPRALDKYGRTVAIVRVNGQDVSSIMRAEGYAKT